MRLEQYWGLDHEREWLASALSLMTLREEKQRFVRRYLATLPLRYLSFSGEWPMEEDEREAMEGFCLRLLYEMERER